MSFWPAVSTRSSQILGVSGPLILGSLGHNIIGATDTFFIGAAGKTELAAIGLMAPFYLLLTMISMALSRGAQIIIARRVGEGKLNEVGAIFQNNVYFGIVLSTLFFLILKPLGEPILSWMIQDPEILSAANDYLQWRLYGIVFGYVGVSAIAMYTGVSRTTAIIFSTLALAITNIGLDYVLVLGRFGFPKMGIGGAGLASAISEVVGLVVFVLYALTIDKKNTRLYELFKFHKPNLTQIKKQINLSLPIVLQSIVGLTAWLIFFSVIEKIGKEEMAFSSVLRVLFLFFGVPIWGIGSATSSIVSELIGKRKVREVLSTMNKIAIISVALTIPFAGLLLIAPEWCVNLVALSDPSGDVLDPAFVAANVNIIYMIFGVLMFTAIYTVFFNGLVGIGDIKASLILSIICCTVYVGYILAVYFSTYDFYLVWTAEIVYASLTLILLSLYLRSGYWKRVTV